MVHNKTSMLSLCLTLILPVTGSAAVVTFNPFVPWSDINTALGGGGGNGTDVSGFAYAGNKFVGSVYPDNGQLYQTDLLGGAITTFGAPIPGGADELYVSSSLGLGGFPSRDIYASAGSVVGGLYHFSNNGTAQGTFSVSGAIALNSEFVKGINFDPYGNYNYDMIVTTIHGNVYTVNSLGVATLLASIPGQILEGIDFAPAAFGSVGGQVIVAAEGANTLFAISTTGVVTNLSTLGISITMAEAINFVPPDLGLGGPQEGYYSAVFPMGGIVVAEPSQFAGMSGDAIVTSEFTGNVTDVHWNGTSFALNPVGNLGGQAEDAFFVTQAIAAAPAGSVPEPATLALLSLGLAGLGVCRRKRSI